MFFHLFPYDFHDFPSVQLSLLICLGFAIPIHTLSQATCIGKLLLEQPRGTSRDRDMSPAIYRDFHGKQDDQLIITDQSLHLGYTLFIPKVVPVFTPLSSYLYPEPISDAVHLKLQQRHISFRPSRPAMAQVRGRSAVHLETTWVM